MVAKKTSAQTAADPAPSLPTLLERLNLSLTLARHNVQIPDADLFGVSARLKVSTRLPELPTHSREAIEQELATLDVLEIQIESAEQRLESIIHVSVEADQLKTRRAWARSSAWSDTGDRQSRSISNSRAPGEFRGNVNRNLKWALVAKGNLTAFRHVA